MTETEAFIKTIENNVIVDKDNGAEIRFSKTIPPTEREMNEAERSLGIKLPDSYKDFLNYCGAADFYGMRLWDLSQLYRFDEACWEMEGFIPFAMDHMGRHHCFKPIDDQKEYAVYITSHDPFGYGKVADHFLDWCKLQHSIMLNFEKGEANFKHPFIDVEKDIYESWKRYKTTLPKKWFQFWK